MPGTSMRAKIPIFKNVNLKKTLLNETNTFLRILKKFLSELRVNETIYISNIVINVKTVNKLNKRTSGAAKNLSLGSIS
jgi:hypothetical protein